MAKQVEYPGSPVVPVVNKARTYRVVSISRPGEFHIVDLAKDTCTCDRCKYHPNDTELCRPKRWAVSFEQEQAQVQAAMPMVTARLKSQVTGERATPRVAGMTQDELRSVFA